MNTIYGQDICNYGAGTLRNSGGGFGGRKAVAGLRKSFSRFLRFVAVLLLMVVGVSSVWGAKQDYWFFIVNKSGKIVTYAKANIEQTNNANGNQIPAAIKSVNATNWRLYNGDQLASNLENITLPDELPQVTKPDASYVVDCSSWGTVTLVDNPTTMSKLSNCESSTRYPNCIFVFYDYDENSVPDLRNGTFYTMQFRGGYTKNGTWDPTNCFLYYNTSNNRMASTANFSGSHPVTNPVTSEEAVNDPKYLWNFKAAEVGGVVDPYDVKIYNAYVGIGDNHYFVADPLDAGGDGAGSGPENENNKLQPKSILNSDKIASYYFATSYYSGQYNITGKPAYNEGSGNTTVQSTIYYNLWGEYQHDGKTTTNISKGGITSQSNFQRTNSGRRNFASIILTRVKYTYNIVDASGNIIVQATTEDNALEVPDVIKSPLATYTYYATQQDAIDGTNPLTGSTAGGTTTIYVRYTTNDVLNLKGEIKYNISVGGTNYLYAADATTLSSEATIDNNGIDTHKWILTGNDAYQIAIKNVDNDNEIAYDVSGGEAVPTLSETGSKFFFHQSTSGQYEVVAVTDDDYTTGYYSLGMASSTLKLYSSSNYPIGEDEVQTVFTPRASAAITTPPTANLLTYNGSNQELVSSGTAENGTMKYRLGNTGSYTESIPEAKDAGSYNVYYMAAGDDGYEDFIAAEPVLVTINPKAVTISAKDASKVYNGSALTESDFEATALETGDEHTFTVEMTTGSTITDAGTQPNVIATVDGVAVTTGTETAVGNYLVTTADGTLTINPKAVTITAGSASETYNGTALTESGFTASALEEGDTHPFTVVMTTESTITNVGTKDNEIATVDGVAVTTGTETTVGNYKVTTAKGTLTVDQKEVGLGWSSASLTYNGMAQAPTATATGVVNGDEVSVTVTGTETNVGTGYTATASELTGEKAGNYKLPDDNTTTFEISAKTLTITAVDRSKTYGDADPELTYTSEGLVGSDAISGALSRAEGEIVGDYAINQGTLTAGGNYVISYTGANLTITQKALTITANSDSKEYNGTALTNDGYTNTDLAAGDVIESVTVTGSQTDKGSSDNVPSAAVIKKGETDVTACYDITYVNGTLSVTGKVITITANSDSKDYDGTALTNGGCSYDNTKLEDGDEITSVTVTGSQTIAGSSGNVASAAVIKHGETDVTGNYTVYYVDGTLTVTQRALTITADSETKEYDGTPLTKNTFINTDLATGDYIESVTIASSQTDVGTSDNEPTAAVIKNASDEDVTSSYAITFAKGTLTVTAKEVTITANDASKPYDGTALTEDGFTTSDLETSDMHTFTVAMTAASTITNVGTQANVIATVDGEAVTTGTAKAIGNYIVTTANGTLTISPKSIGNGALASGFSISFDTDNSIILKDGETTLTINNDYTIDDEVTTSASGRYSIRTVRGTGNYGGTADIRNAIVTFTNDGNGGPEYSATFVAESANPDIDPDNTKGHALPEGITAYIITAINGNTATTEALDYMPEGVPVLLLANTDVGGFLVQDVSGKTPPTGTNLLKEVTEDSKHFEVKTIYLLYKNEFAYNKEGDLGKWKVYLDPTPAGHSPARLVINWDTDNGIDTSYLSPLASQIPEKWYSFDGRRLNGKPTKKGLYIKNGQKVVIK